MIKKNLWWKILLALVSAGALLQLSLVPVAAQPQPNVPLSGNVPAAVANGILTPTGTADESQPVTLVIGVKLANPAGVQAAVAAVRSGREAPLTPQQFVDQYAATADNYTAVVSWLTAQGFSVQTSPNRLIVTATGSLGQAARAFGITVQNYSMSGRTYYANATAPQVPANLTNIVESVAGLDNLPTFHALSMPTSPGGKTVANSVYYDSSYGGFTPLGIQKAYDVTPVLGTTAGQVYGTGQTVDIVIWNSILQSDVDSFNSTYGLPSITINQIQVDGPVTTDFNNGSMEATLDVEMVHSLAPGAAIDVFEAPNSSFAPMEEAVVQHNANVLSMSWAADENGMAGYPYLMTMDAIFAQAAAEGMTLLAASGDDGEYQYNESSNQWEQAVSYPASDPYVTGVGGTALTPTADGSYGGETAWNAMEGLGYYGCPPNPPAYFGSGGGFSTAFIEPAWQVPTVDGYTYNNTNYNTGNYRGVPDLALNAGGLNSAYINGNWAAMIGTSIGSPSWAGLVALLDQHYASAGQPPLGYFNPLLYNLGNNDKSDYQSVFHQVYIGDNDTKNVGDSPYYAAYGWNPVTGWGTPDFQKLFNYLSNLPAASYPPSITASPTAVPSDYPGTPQITITGTNTHFSQANTTVSLFYNGNNLASNVAVQSNTSLTFTLAVIQNLTGEGNVTVYDPTDGNMTATLDFGVETATISPDTLTEGYANNTTITITGGRCYYDNTHGGVTVQVVNAADQTPAIDLGGPGTPGMQATLPSSSPPYTTASFNLPAGLAAGQYDVVVNDNATGVSMSVPLTVTATGVAINNVTVNPSNSTAGTAQSVAVNVTTSGATGGTGVTANLLDSNSNIKATASNTITGDAATLNLQLPASLPAGTYTVQVVIPGASGSPYTTSYAINQGSAISSVNVNPPSGTAGTAHTVNVDVATTNAPDGTAVTVNLLDSGSNIVATAGGTISGNDVTLSLQVPATLPAGSYRVRVLISGASNSPYDAGNYNVVPAPTMTGAATDTTGNTVIVTFDKTMSTPPATPAGFTVTVSGSADAVTRVALHAGDSTKYDLTLATAVLNGQTVTLAYDSSGGVTSADGGVLASIAAQPVTNNVPGGGGGGGGGGGSSSSNQAVTSTTGSASVPPSAGGTVGLGTNATVTIPAGALQGTANATVAVQTSNSPPAAPSGFMFLGQTYQFTVNGQDHYTFDKSVTMTFTFDPSKIPAGESPAVYYYDDTTGQWVDLGGTVSGDTITVTVNHFTEYAVIATASKPPVQAEKFPDVAHTWAQASVDKLVSLGAITGYPDGTFRPDNDITRAEFATVLVKALKLAPKTGPVFTDTAGNWAKAYISTAATYGIVSGYDASHFGPNDPVTREQITAMVVRAAKLGTAGGQLSFTDAARIDAWAMGYVATAAKDGIVNGYPDGSFRPLGYATRAEGVTIIAKILK